MSRVLEAVVDMNLNYEATGSSLKMYSKLSFAYLGPF